MNQNCKKIAVIDVDGTLLRGQIQQKLIIFFWKNKQISLWYFLKLNIWFFLYKLGICKDTRSILNYGIKYLKGKSVVNIDQLVDKFMLQKVNESIFPNSNRLLDGLRESGYHLVILSSAIDVVISKVARMFAVDDFVCTETEKINDTYTGKICGNIVYGKGKVDIIKKYIFQNGFSFKNAKAYADHESDIPMLKLMGNAYIVNPNDRMKRIAKREQINIAYTQ